jgi:hypothetical protein
MQAIGHPILGDTMYHSGHTADEYCQVFHWIGLDWVGSFLALALSLFGLAFVCLVVFSISLSCRNFVLLRLCPALSLSCFVFFGLVFVLPCLCLSSPLSLSLTLSLSRLVCICICMCVLSYARSFIFTQLISIFCIQCLEKE